MTVEIQSWQNKGIFPSVILNNNYYLPKVKWTFGEFSTRWSWGEYSPMVIEPEVNNCFSIIFRGEHQGLKSIKAQCNGSFA